VIPDTLLLPRKVAAVPPAFVSCLELARDTIQVWQKDKTKYFKTSNNSQADLDDAGLRVYDRPFGISFLRIFLFEILSTAHLLIYHIVYILLVLKLPPVVIEYMILFQISIL